MGIITGTRNVEPLQYFWIGIKGTKIGLMNYVNSPQEAYVAAQIMAKTGEELEIERKLEYIDNVLY